MHQDHKLSLDTCPTICQLQKLARTDLVSLRVEARFVWHANVLTPYQRHSYHSLAFPDISTPYFSAISPTSSATKNLLTQLYAAIVLVISTIS